MEEWKKAGQDHYFGPPNFNVGTWHRILGLVREGALRSTWESGDGGHRPGGSCPVLLPHAEMNQRTDLRKVRTSAKVSWLIPPRHEWFR